MSSAAARPPIPAARRTATAEPRRAQACHQQRGGISDRDVIPVCSVPYDFFAAWKQQLDRARRRAGPLDLPPGAQLLRLPAVGNGDADPPRPPPLLLHRYGVLQK